MKVIFVTGKGGVGKTSFASALALNKSEQGQKVLLAEFGPKSYLSYIFSSTKKENRITPRPNLEIATWIFEEVLVEFITYFLKVKPLVERFFASPIMKKLIKVAPSLRELVYLGKATSPFRNIGKEMNYDCIIIDAYATGHFLALLRSPAGMMEAVSRGPMHEQCKTILKVMENPEQVAYYVLSLPERLPVLETKEFVASLQDEFSIEPKIVFNKIKPKLNQKGSSHFEKEYQLKQQNEDGELTGSGLNIYKKISYIYETNLSQLIHKMSDQLGDDGNF